MIIFPFQLFACQIKLPKEDDNQNHDASIDEYATGICEAIDNAAKLCPPKSEWQMKNQKGSQVGMNM